jgi:hypothetical protein
LTASLAVLAACADRTPVGLREPERAALVSQPTTRTATRQIIDLYGLTIGAAGAFVPGQPITISVQLRSVVAVNTVWEIAALDVSDDSTATRRVTGRTETTTTDPRQRAGSVMFSEAGYYRVTVTASLRSELPDSLRRREVATSAAETLWILIDSSGGRLTAGFDPSVLSGRRARFGAYGPFETRVAALRVPRDQRRVRSQSSSITVFGTFKYKDFSEEPVYVNAFVPVKGGRINASCIGRSSSSVFVPDVNHPVVSYVGSNGTWAVHCPTGIAYAWDHAEGNIYMDGQYADVRNHNNASVATPFLGYDTDNLTIHAASNPQGFVLSVLEEYAPQAASRFGRSRGKVIVRVHDTDTTYSARYESCCDYMRTHKGRTTGTQGYVTTLHEYGHAYHYVAIDSWDQYSISGGEHGWFEIEHISGAFVEGFANFFAALIGENFLAAGSLGADYNVETEVYYNTLPDSVSGWRIEGAIAGFLYDLVDGTASLNTSSNTSDGVDDDGANYAVSSVADVIAGCGLNGGTKIHGIDQFIYCAEKSLTPQGLQHPTYAKYLFKLRRDTVIYSTLSYASHSLDASVVRAVWLKNLFGL